MAAAASLFLLAFAVYLKTACGTVSCDDSGEICLAARQLSVLHPPGYPVFAAAARVWAEIPVGCIAFRMNMLSALFSAGAVSSIFALWRALMPAFAAAGWAAALLAGCATALWGQSGTAKGAIYSVNAFLTVTVLIALLKAISSGRPSGKAAFAAGIGLAHHWMSALGLIAALAVDAIGRRAGARGIAAGMFLLVLGMSAYALLPIRAAGDPFLNWGTPDNYRRFASVVAREQYTGPKEIGAPAASRLAQISGSLGRVVPWPAVLALAAVGAIFLVQSRGIFAVSIGTYLLVLYGSLLHYGSIRAGAPWYLDIFAIPGNSIVIAAAALGLVKFWDYAARGRRPLVPAMLLAAAAFGALNSRWEECDRSREYLTHDLAVNLADSGRGKRLLLASSDVLVFGNWDLWHIQGRNRQLYAVPAPLLPQQWVAVSFSKAVPGLRAPYPAARTGAEAVPALMRAWYEANAGNFEVRTFKTDASKAAFLPEYMHPYGLTVGIGKRREGAEAPPNRLRLRGLYGPELKREPRIESTFQPIYFSGFISWANARMDDDPGAALALTVLAGPLAAGPQDQALVSLARGNIAVRTGRVGQAVDFYREACRLDPLLGAGWRNLAVAQLSLGRTQEAKDTYRKLKLAAPESEEIVELDEILSQLERGRALKR